MKTLPLKEMSIAEVYNGEKVTYEVPIYQRNYAWEKDEISTLIQDVFDAYESEKQTYFIGTLVSFHKGDQTYEVIDGQQRLTTINLVLKALNIDLRNKLTYRARKKSNESIESIPHFNVEEKDEGIVNGFKYAQGAIKEIVPTVDIENFKKYFQNQVRLIHYQVPKDIDLNSYFEIMNSRGEQLEKHEIIKARLIEKLKNKEDEAKFHQLWEFCSEMNVYIQQKYINQTIFGEKYCNFKISNFDDLPNVELKSNKVKIQDLIGKTSTSYLGKKEDKIDSFQPIMDFSNFLLIVLKLTRIGEEDFDPIKFNLDDKELIKEFDKVRLDEDFTKKFGFNLLKAKFLLDNYNVHHSNEDDTLESNPWKLQHWQKEGKNSFLKNLEGTLEDHNKLVHLLSMFEVSFTARQRKNYLFYCLFYLFRTDDWSMGSYLKFTSQLADKYFIDVYMEKEKLNEINTPKPGSFDNSILIRNTPKNQWTIDIDLKNDHFDFDEIYGNGSTVSKGIPLFIFNYLDYKLWECYSDELRGDKTKEGSPERNNFFKKLGCSDFGLKIFDQFYFSRTRRSLEHYFPQANVKGKINEPNKEQINCLGNYAMIGNEANSSGSNWTPKAKRIQYLDVSGKVKLVSVASIKFIIMMQKCIDNDNKREPGQEWIFEDIMEHQEKMLVLLIGDIKNVGVFNKNMIEK